MKRWLALGSTALIMNPLFAAEPAPLVLNLLGRYSTGVYEKSAAEIPAFDPASKRAFVVNAQKGVVDVLDLRDPNQPVALGELSATAVLPQAVVNSVAVKNGIVAIAIEAPVKTNPGKVAFFRATDLSLISHVGVGAQPDMLTFTPDGKSVVVANEGEPSADYQTDPEGSVSIIHIQNLKKPAVRTADFRAFNGREKQLRKAGVRIYGPYASAAQDLEPEYITISADSTTAWVTLQENNALAKVDLKQAKVSDVLPLGFKDHGAQGNGLDVSDKDKKINIRTWVGVKGMYQPDSIASYSVAGNTYLVLANEGDARAWGEDDKAYWAGDAAKGFVEEIRVKNLLHKDGFAGQKELPPQLAKLAKGAVLNPAVFADCGAGACIDDEQLGRLTVSWTQGYQVGDDGLPKLNADGKLVYDQLFAQGGRSFSIRDANGKLVWDSGDQFEQQLAKIEPKFFNTNHGKTAFDDRSDNKGPEPEGLAIGQIGERTYAFIGLERMSGIMMYDISNPAAPTFAGYTSTRNFEAKELAAAGDLGPEGLAFVAEKDSPTGEPLLIVGNEVSGTTAIFSIIQ
ncbi:choice-of-anchor I family protein [Chitinibacter sp. GC72]|uniref:choice-of-anchor I family protein n=1 Tax=Chitinibacter sp. GC72 TaxID=1526917 RepID=UPI0012FB4CF5|nr:choice-of-anchor I family protein [Chitinibacter sp. GC72]